MRKNERFRTRFPYEREKRMEEENVYGRSLGLDYSFMWQTLFYVIRAFTSEGFSLIFA